MQRTVTLSDVDDKTAMSKLSGEQPMDGLDKAVVRFTKVECYTTFVAEYGVKEGDVVFHFFLTPELDALPKNGEVALYWVRIFPQALDLVAQDYFKAGFPRLQAKYTEELQSWWLRAQGFGDSLDVDGLAGRLLELLDEALDTAQPQAS